MVTFVVVVLCSLGTLIGVLGAFLGIRGQSQSDGGRVRVKVLALVHGGARLPLAAAFVGFVAAAITGWPVIGVFTALAVTSLPIILRAPSAKSTIAKMEGVATWTELVRDTIQASAGLAQAIITTAPVAPVPIRPVVLRLAGHLSNGLPLERALREFAAAIDDPSADVVVSALVLASTARVQRLVDLLDALAASTREEVSMRLRIESSRASARSGVRTIVAFSLCFAAALVVLARSYLAPYSTLEGQLVLLLVGCLYAVGVVSMIWMVRPQERVRILEPSRYR
jgi:tight adherence protein B